MDLDAIEAAEKAMTPGPWERDKRAAAHVNAGERGICSCSCYSNNQDEKVPAENDANATGIVLLRNSAREMVAEIRRLRQFVADSGSTCYPCETCGHGRTTLECIWCERDRLRKLCGEAADNLRGVYDSSIPFYFWEIKGRLRAASKGEQ